METVAVFDHGKTNLKLSVVSVAGEVLDCVSTPTPSRPGPPYRHIDLEAIEAWLLPELRGRGVRSVVATAHGSGMVLVDDHGPVLPMIDYEQPVPDAVDAEYRRLMPPFVSAGSGVLGAAAHLARQLVWSETGWPEAVARARHLLPLAQYWAWRLSGRAALELTSLGAQSHLWDAYGRRFSELVGARGWDRLMPPIRPAWDRLGTFGGAEVLCGIHDSSANFYRLQRAGLGGSTLLSTGTWIVGLRAGLGPEALVEERSMTVNMDVHGDPVAGVLTIAGRERAALAGEGLADEAGIARLVRDGVMALPSFVPFSGVFPGSAGKGRIVGDGGGADLGTLYAALVADACLDLLRAEGSVVVDGGFVADPAFARLLAALRPGDEVMVDARGNGTTVGAALLWTHGEARSVPATLDRASPLDVPGLADYRENWRDLAERQGRNTGAGA